MDVGGLRLSLPEREVGALQAGLKQLVTRLSEAELILVRAWVEQEIKLARRPALRLIRTPSSSMPEEFSGTFVELAGHVRRRLHELPEDRLIVLLMWVSERLRHDYRHHE